MKRCKIKNAQNLVARMNYPKFLDAVNIDDPDAVRAQEADAVPLGDAEQLLPEIRAVIGEFLESAARNQNPSDSLLSALLHDSGDVRRRDQDRREIHVAGDVQNRRVDG